MKKCKVFCIAFSLITVFVMLMGLSACKPKEKDENAKLVFMESYTQNMNPYITDYFDEESKLNLAEKIDSVKELIAFCDEKKLSVFDENASIYNDSISKMLRELNNEFFINYSIILVFRFKENPNNYIFDSINIKNGTMNINFVTANGNATSKARTNVYIFEINKKDAKTINTIKINESLGEIDKTTKIYIYNLSYINTFGDYKISNLTELNALLKNEILPNIRHEDDLNEIAINKLKEYNDIYFQNKSLILLIYGRGDTRFYSVKSFDIKDMSISITLSTTKLPEDTITIWHPQYYFYIFEIDKTRIENIVDITVNSIEE